MKIEAIEYEVHKIELTEPYQIAYETISHCENVSLILHASNGVKAYGLAAPDKEITGENAADVVNAIEQLIIPLLKNQHPFRLSHWMHELKKQPTAGPSAKAMVDIALHDLLAKKANIPLHALLGGFRKSIPTSITIGIKSLEETIAIAQKYQQQGFNIIKLKGGLQLEEDIEKTHRLREVLGKKITIRFDANQGYSVEQALEFVKRTMDARVEILEQPSHKDATKSMALITKKSAIPVMADESLKSLSDAIHLTKQDAIDMVNIKLQKVGGISEAKHINSVAKSSGIESMISCLDECSLGIAAGLHFALSSPNIQFADLDGHIDMINDPYQGLFTIRKGILYPNQLAGIGIA